MQPLRVELLGVPVDCVDMRKALDRVDEIIEAGRPEMVIAVNPEKVIKARRDRRLLSLLPRAGLLIPDGAGVVFAARWLGLGRMERVAGSDLMLAICERSVVRGYRLFLFGGSPEVNHLAADALRRRYAHLQIVGQEHGYLQDDQMPELIRRINASRADVLFVALGSPRQEQWMGRYLNQLDVKVCQGVGGTFDVLAGRIKRAPLSFRHLHLEWFYRLITQPSRIIRQTALPKFAVQVLWKRVIG
ncbi:MAG TPA: WecB/TagA/CpsF family glycosyltransferase [Nitrospiria bacterium]|nr:WecB/TagA/CpsF family glycosyltransferase [Nitrospiria bacterium]